MKRWLPALTATAALLTTHVATAASWEFQTLSLSDSMQSQPAALTLVSQSATETVVTLDSLAALSGRYAALDNYTSPTYDNTGVGNWMMVDIEQFQVAVRDGYRVTGVTFDVAVNGQMRAGQPNGTASNTFTIDFGLGAGDGSTNGFMTNLGEVHDLNGVLHLNKTVAAESLTDRFVLSASPYEWTEARAARHISAHNDMYYFDEESYSNIRADEIKVTFHTAAISAVPEPGTYLMLGTGLALLGLARRRHSGR